MQGLHNSVTESSNSINLQPEKKSLFSLQKYLNLTRFGFHKKTVMMVAATFCLFLLLLIIFLVNHQSENVSNLAVSESVQAKTILSQLSDINVQLQQLSANAQSSAEFKTALVTINNDLSGIEKSVNDLAKSSDVQKMSDQIGSMQTDVDGQMLDLKRIVANSSKDYLDPKVLPFKVLSIDVISQQPFVSIDYDHHLTPLTIGDSLAGWQITSADYDAGQVEFKNDHNQYVKVALQG